MKRKTILYLFLACLCIQLLVSCSGKKSENSNVGKGRYIETELELPFINNQTAVVSQVLLPDGSTAIYTEDWSKPDSISLTRYTYESSNTTYQEETPQWLQDIPTSGSTYNVQVLQGADGTEYLFVIDKNGGSLYKTTDDKTRIELKMEGWDDLNSDGQYKILPITIGLLENGLLVANTTSGCYLYDMQSGKQKKQVTDKYVTEVLAVAGNKFVVVNEGDDGEEIVISLSIFDANNLDGAPEVIKFDTPIPLDTSVFLNNKGDVILANTEGIHILKKGTGTWQTVVDGSLNTMYIPNIVCDSILQDKNDNYYIVYRDFYTNDFSVMKYQFDDTVNTVPAKELTIYTLEDSPLLRAAANTFQKEHKDYKVSIQVARTENTALTKEDYIRSLNTQLLSGSGCDLILLDGLPLDSYIEKGVLADLSGIIDPMMKDNMLFSNIVNSYYLGNKIYALPSRIKLPSIYGKAEVVKTCGTLDDLAAYVKNEKGKPISSSYTYEDIISQFLPCYMHNIKTIEGQINADGIKKFLEDIKIILDNTSCISKYTKENRRPYFLDLPVNASIYKDTATNLMSMGIILSFAHFVEGDFTTFENSYEPANVIGINKSSKQQKIAKEFIECLLSGEVQMYDIEGAGFPINIDAFEKMKVPKWWEGDYPIVYQDGKEGTVPLSDLSDADKEKLINYCKTVTERAYTDDNILNAIKEYGKNYILEDKPIDDTVALIINKLSTYSEE